MFCYMSQVINDIPQLSINLIYTNTIEIIQSSYHIIVSVCFRYNLTFYSSIESIVKALLWVKFPVLYMFETLQEGAYNQLSISMNYCSRVLPA